MAVTLPGWSVFELLFIKRSYFRTDWLARVRTQKTCNLLFVCKGFSGKLKDPQSRNELSKLLLGRIPSPGVRDLSFLGNVSGMTVPVPHAGKI